MKKTIILGSLTLSMVAVLVGFSGSVFADTPAVQDSCDKTITLQQFLVDKGYLNVTPTGYYGPLTRAAVMKFQASQNIMQTGFVGPLTRAALRNVGCGIQKQNQLLNVTDPVAGATLVRGTFENIIWTMFQPQTFAAGNIPPNTATYTVTLAPVRPVCPPGSMCPMIMMVKPYVLATNVSSMGNYRISLPWKVATSAEADRTIPDGKYTISVCTNDNALCAESGAITISSTNSNSSNSTDFGVGFKSTYTPSNR